MDLVYKITKTINKVINGLIFILLLLVFLFAFYVLWDAWNIVSDPPISKDRPAELERLHKQNSDVIGWLTIDDTNIDYPLLIGETNAEYLNKNETGEYSLAGSLFLDYRNNRDFSDFSTIIYGHNVTGGRMFGGLLKFEDSKYFETHVTGTLYTLDSIKPVEVYAFMKTDAYDQIIYNPKQDSEESRLEFLQYIKAEAFPIRNQEITLQDKMLVLSTCHSVTTDGRAILILRIAAE